MSKHVTKRIKPDSQGKRLPLLLPLMVTLAVIPLIFRLYRYDTGLQEYDFFSKNGISNEFALHGKMVAFIAVSAVMLLLIAYRCIREKKLLFDKMLIPLFAYGILAILSSIFSKYQPYPRTGVFEQFESCFVLIGYVIVVYYAFLFIRDGKDVRLLIGVLAAGAGLLVLVGLSQAMDHDILGTGFGRWLTIPSEYYSRLSSTGEEFVRKFKVWRVFMTFSNPNYVGSYVPLVLPVMLIVAFDTVRIRNRIIYGILCLGLLICLFGSGSKTGFAGLIVSLAIVAVYLARSGRKSVIFTISGAFIVLLVVYIFFGNNDYLKRIKSVFNIEETVYDVTGIETLDDGVRIVYKNKGLTVSFDPDMLGFSCRDDNGEELYMSLNDNQKLIVDEPGYEGLTIGPVELEDGIYGFEIYASRAWYFARLDGVYYFYTPYKKFIRHSISESTEWLDRHGLVATGRGFLWSRTLPLLKNNIILGSGADTFVFEYPGADFVASYNSGNWGFVVTKPHCMYLQIAVQTGILSLAAILVFYVMFVAGSLKIINGKVMSGKTMNGKEKSGTIISGKTVSERSGYLSDNTREDGVSIYAVLTAIVAGTAGYMTAAIFNDSSIAVAPVFWALTGIGAAIVRIGRETQID